MATLPAGFPAMFGMGGGGGAPEPLVKFKAGRCELEPLSGAQQGSFNVTAVAKKGEVQVVRNDEGMTQFVWKDRTTMQVDPTCDHLVFPGDAQFEKIDTGREGDRVFSLQFTANRSRRFFFWMQDKDASKDEERVASVNAHINRTGEVAGGDGDGLPPGATPEQAAMMQMMVGPQGAGGGAGGAAAGGAGGGGGGAGAAGGAAGQVSLADLQSVMASLGMPPAGAASPGAPAAAPAAAPPARPPGAAASPAGSPPPTCRPR